jgi:hypothetical protein
VFDWLKVLMVDRCLRVKVGVGSGGNADAGIGEVEKGSGLFLREGLES